MAIDMREYFTDIIEIFDGSIYFKDINGMYLGCNRYAANKVGLDNPNDIIGKTDSDLFGKAEADIYRKNDLIVFQEAKELAVEEVITLPSGEQRVHRSVKKPLFNKNEPGVIIGLVGYTIDITAKKEAERLRLESETQKIVLQEKEKFAQLASKVAHDINSPLSALKMMIPLCDDLPEERRISLTRATERIWDIANNLLSNFRQQKKKASTAEVEPRQPLLVSDLLIELLSEKKMEYRDRPVKFDTTIAHGAEFAFIQCQATEFRRAMSNLINNAVDALKNKNGDTVTIHLDIHADTVEVEVIDNGNGMPSIMIEKMRRRQSFTTGKKSGHGLGLQQIWDTLEYNQGTMDVQSKLHQGTAIKLTFPRIAAPSWIAQDIHLAPDSIILILDDDDSIHAAWDLRFLSLSTSNPMLRLFHFIQGQEVPDFVGTLSQEEKSHLVFLSDYELLHQERNGIQIIEASEIKGAMLVTSYYSNPKIRKETDRLGIKVLPKQMASVIPIYVD